MFPSYRHLWGALPLRYATTSLDLALLPRIQGPSIERRTVMNSFRACAMIIVLSAAVFGSSCDATSCVDGQSAQCACTDGKTGAQSCMAGRYGTCECLAAADLAVSEPPDLAVLADLSRLDGASGDAGASGAPCSDRCDCSQGLGCVSGHCAAASPLQYCCDQPCPVGESCHPRGVLNQYECIGTFPTGPSGGACNGVDLRCQTDQNCTIQGCSHCSFFTGLGYCT
jgi:hypothetical protein